MTNSAFNLSDRGFASALSTTIGVFQLAQPINSVPNKPAT
jgi:hypothetical protein